MECNRDEAARAKEIADTKLANQDIPGAKKFALKAQCLYPQLDGLSQLMATIDVFVSASNKVAGEVDWYGVFGVSPVADEETVKKQYKKLALVLHPDKNKSPGADDAFKLIGQAWSLLSDKSKRLAYNQRRSPRGSTQSVPIRTNSSPSVPPQSNGVYGYAPRPSSASKPQVPTDRQHQRQEQNSNKHAPVGSSFPAERNAKSSNKHAPAGSSFPVGRNGQSSNKHAPAGSSFPAERNAKSSTKHAPAGSSFPAGRNDKNSNNHAAAGRNAASAPKSSAPGPAGVHSVKHRTSQPNMRSQTRVDPAWNEFVQQAQKRMREYSASHSAAAGLLKKARYCSIPSSSVKKTTT